MKISKLWIGFLISTMTLMLLTIPISAGQDRFVPIADGLAIRIPEKVKLGKNFNIGIYISDVLVETNPSDGSGGDYGLAELYISVSGTGVCTMCNDWFEAQGLTIGPTDDLIVVPYISGWIDPDGIPGSGDEIPILEYSMEYDLAVSKLGDIIGWTGNVVCNADMVGTYLFTLMDSVGATLGSFNIDVI